MSGILAMIGLDGAPVPAHVGEKMLAGLAHRGPSGRFLRVAENIVIGLQQSWATQQPAEVERPLVDGDVALLFDGRLDNRDELSALLGLDAVVARRLSDAALVLRAWRRWGEGALQRLLGPFAVIVADTAESKLLCARDPMGGRTLVFGGDRTTTVVASEEQVVLAYPGGSRELDESSLAALFASRPRGSGATYFRDVSELPPGHLLRVDGDGVRVKGYWTWSPGRIGYRSDAEYGEHFLELLTAAVRARLRCPGRVGVLMSGGLDSTSVATIAAREIGAGHRLKTVSWTFDELEACDESSYIDAVAEHCGLESLRVGGDDAWPLGDAESWPHDPNRPVDNPYRRLKERAYDVARENGLQVLLTGGFGDHLYTGSEEWLVEQLLELRWASAGRELAWYAARGRLTREGGVRRLRAQLLRRQPQSRPPPWLTEEAARLLPPRSQPASGLNEARRPSQAASVCGPLAADSVIGEIPRAARHGLELRHPYRDRRLVEFMLAIPADQLYRRGLFKQVLRTATRELLPDLVRRRPRPTSLTPLYLRGLAERERALVDELLAAPDALWRRFVLGSPQAPLDEKNTLDGAKLLIPWGCAYLELWRRAAATTPRRAGA